MMLQKSIKRKNNMLTVTEIAKEKLREDLQKKTTDPEKAIRLVSSPSEPNQLMLVLDKIRERDQVVVSKEGIKVLLIGPYLGSELEGMVVDYQETAAGAGFTISTPASGT
jgi:Fe-S cluster assembly iron-binding protein IscA